MMTVRSSFATLATLGTVVACSTGRVTTSPSPTAVPASNSSTAVPVAVQWPVKSLPHVDLWLHSFAMISEDTAPVPLFRRNYRDSVTVVKNRGNLLTSLDANRATLSAGLTRNAGYVQAQFLAFEFDNWEQMRGAIEQFLQAQGDPQRARDRASQQNIVLISNYFRTAPDREWLRLFLTGVIDENARFYSAEHTRNWRERSATVTAVDSLWQLRYRPLFQRFLANTSQRNGDFLLSMPVGGEGRAIARADGRAAIAVTFPVRPEDAREPILVFAHEVTGSIVGSSVNDNTSPAEQRNGVAERMVAAGQVQAGAMLLQRIAPDLVQPYVQFYLRQVGKTGTTVTALEQAFPVPTAVRESIRREIEVVLGGI